MRPDPQTANRQVVLVLSLPAVMVSGTFAAVMLGVLASDLIQEFSIHRWQIGVLVMITALLGGLLSPWAGMAIDRVGARQTAIFVSFLGVVAILLTAGAVSIVFLFAAAVINGVTNSLVNPSTNKLISQHIPVVRQGYVTGIKQSGVQFGAMMSGAILPVATTAWGWRWAVAVCALFPLVFLVAGMFSLPPDLPRSEMASQVRASGPVPQLVKRLAVYAFLMGSGGVCVFTYLPLYAQEELGVSYALAGAAVAVAGLSGVVSRILVGMAAHRFDFGILLQVLAALSIVATLSLSGGKILGPASMWIAALFAGVGTASWNTVAMLVVIQLVPGAITGRASGVVLLGFLSGVGLGAPIFGWSVDILNSYLPGWLAVSVFFIGGGLVAARSRLVPMPASP